VFVRVTDSDVTGYPPPAHMFECVGECSGESIEFIPREVADRSFSGVVVGFRQL